MKIIKINFHHLRIPLRLTFAQANQNTKQSESVIVRIETNEGQVGFGEACPRTYVSGESVDSVRQTIKDWTPELLDTQFEQLEDIRSWVLGQLDSEHGPAAVCALELALLDAWSKTFRQDLQDALGQVRPLSKLEYAGVIPYGKWEHLSAIVRNFSFASWKFKGYEEVALNEQRIKDMQTLLGENIPIRIDANGGWSLAKAHQQIAAGLSLGVYSFEQAVNDDQDAVQLMEKYGTQIQLMADESLVHYTDAKRLIDSKACNHFSLKLSKNGGIFNSLRIYERAQANGILCQLSAHFGETSILSAAGALFASLVPDLSALEGALGTYLLREDICRSPLMVTSQGKLPHQELSYQGWPIIIDELKLNQFSVRTEYWKR